MLSKLAAVMLSLVFISPTTQAPIQQPNFVPPQRKLHISIEGDFSVAQLLRRELMERPRKTGISISFVEREKPYDLRILLTSGVGSDSGSCTGSCSATDASCTVSSSSCSVSVTINFVGAVGLTPEGKLQFTEAGLGSTREYAINRLTSKLVKRL